MRHLPETGATARVDVLRFTIASGLPYVRPAKLDASW
jgi:hypothetical protein